MKISFIIVSTIIIIAILFFTKSQFPPVNSETDQLAECLASKDVTIYVSKYCGHCQDQKELFGDSFQKLNSIDCAINTLACQEAGITGVPTWVISGESYPGVQSLSKLKELTNC